LGLPVFRELADASAGVDRRTLRAGRRAARRGEAAPDAASARVAVARARAVRAEVRDGEETDTGVGWRAARVALGVAWLLLTVVHAVDGDPAGIWTATMGIFFLGSAARSPDRRYARARRAETRNRAVLREHGVAYPANDDTVYVRPPLAAAVAAVVPLAAIFAAVFALLLSALGRTFPPDDSDVVFGAALGLVLTSIWAFAGWRRTDPYAEPPAPVGL
jgi:hypothetical protein